MKVSKKVAAALQRRRKGYNDRGPSDNKNQTTVMPGSQNRKKGYGVSRSKSR